MRNLLFFIALSFSLSSHTQYDFQDRAAFESFLKKQLEISEKTAPIDFKQKLPPEKIIADLRILKWCLEEAQTSLYRHASKNEIETAFNNAFETCNDSLTYLEFVRELGKLEHTIACGHSGWNHSEAYQNYRNENIKFLPVRVRYEGENCVIFQDNSLSHQLQENGLLVGVNGIPVDILIKKLKTFMGRDGESMQHSTMEPAKYFNMAYSNFIGNPEKFELEIRAKEEKQAKIYTIAALHKSTIDSIQAVRYPNWNSRGLPLQLDLDVQSSSALYTIEWFRKDYIFSKGQDFETFTDSVFQVLNDQKIKNLYIDLRGNTGGWTAYGKYLLAYFIDEPVGYMTSVVANKYQDFSYAAIETIAADYDDTMQMKLNEDGLYAWENYPSFTAIPAGKNRFTGRVFVLTDNFTRSCSGMFCSLLRENTDAIFIGEETGATQCGAAGIISGIELPHTKIRMHFSTAQYNCAISNPQNARGVLPDIKRINQPKKGGDWAEIRALVKKQLD